MVQGMLLMLLLLLLMLLIPLLLLDATDATGSVTANGCTLLICYYTHTDVHYLGISHGGRGFWYKNQQYQKAWQWLLPTLLT